MHLRILLCLVLALPVQLWAASAEVHSSQKPTDISGSFELLRANPGQYTAEELLDPGVSGVSGVFAPLNPPVNVVSHRGVAWLRATLDLSRGDQLEIPGQLLNYVDIWFKLPGGEVVHDYAGVRYERSSDHPGVVFPIPGDRQGRTVVLIRMKNDSTQPINFAAWVWPEVQWQDYLLANRVWYGAYVGAILVLCLYNLFLALTLRDPSYLFYVGYTLSLMFSVVLLSGMVGKYLPTGTNISALIEGLSGMGAFLAVGFVNSFLGVHRIWPGIYRVSTGLALLVLLMSITVFFGVASPLPLNASLSASFFQGAGPVAGVYFVAVSLWLFFQGMVQARFLALSMSLLLIFVSTYFFYTYGFLPYSLYIGHFLEVGSLLEGVLLSFALADRINILYSEKRNAQREALEHQRKFSRGLIEVQENERRELSEHLHDAIGHSLLVLKNNLQKYSSQLPSSGAPEKTSIDEQIAFCGELIGDVRAYAHNLHPHMLARLGLATAIESTIERSMSSAGILWRVNIADIPAEINGNVAITVYRVIQECLNNVIKYSQAKELCCTITINNNNLDALLSDNGRGFKPGDKNKPTLGLHGMAERVRLLGGVFAVYSKPGRGTRVSFHIPLSG